MSELALDVVSVSCAIMLFCTDAVDEVPPPQPGKVQTIVSPKINPVCLCFWCVRMFFFVNVRDFAFLQDISCLGFVFAMRNARWTSCVEVNLVCCLASRSNAVSTCNCGKSGLASTIFLRARRTAGAAMLAILFVLLFSIEAAAVCYRVRQHFMKVYVMTI